MVSLTNAQGPCITNVRDISSLEYGDPEINKTKNHNLYKLSTSTDRRNCHVNPHNNRVLATIIKEVMDNGIDYLNLAKDPRFSFDVTHLQYLIDELYDWPANSINIIHKFLESNILCQPP